MPPVTEQTAINQARADTMPGERITVDRPLYGRQRYVMLPAAPGDLVKELRTDDVTLETLAAMD